MLNPQALQLRVGVDVGSQCHSVAVGLTDGSLLEEFELKSPGLYLEEVTAEAPNHHWSAPGRHTSILTGHQRLALRRSVQTVASPQSRARS